jgi:RNase adapter protein RapZ
MLTRGVDTGRPVALGVDSRTRGFSADTLLKLARATKTRMEAKAALVFLDCDDEVLIRRFKETRRRHPLALDRPVSDGIRIERSLLAPLRDSADLVIDTSVLMPSELRRLLAGRFGLERAGELTVTVISFAYRQGVPREADLVFDTRFLRNPHYDESLKSFDGRDRAVASHIEADPDFARFFEDLTRLVGPLLPRFLAEGKSYLTIGIGCTGGRHRSVFVAERLAAWLGAQGFKAGVSHRDVHRASLDTP